MNRSIPTTFVLVYNSNRNMTQVHTTLECVMYISHFADGINNAGNKCDCSERVVDRVDGEHLAHQYGVSYMETSAKTGLNVEQAFVEVAK